MNRAWWIVPINSLKSNRIIQIDAATLTLALETESNILKNRHSRVKLLKLRKES